MVIRYQSTMKLNASFKFIKPVAYSFVHDLKTLVLCRDNFILIN